MPQPCYLNMKQAQQTLAELGITYTERQMKRAAEMDAHGRRKLPFFIDPIDGRLKIERNTLINLYLNRQISAEKNAYTPNLG